MRLSRAGPRGLSTPAESLFSSSSLAGSTMCPEEMWLRVRLIEIYRRFLSNVTALYWCTGDSVLSGHLARVVGSVLRTSATILCTDKACVWLSVITEWRNQERRAPSVISEPDNSLVWVPFSHRSQSHYQLFFSAGSLR